MSLAWWQSGIVYQVYPRSFADSDGDGTGDLRGIVARLDHLVWLGVDALWVSPVFPSPMTDFGYDVADYCGIDPLFGTMADMDALIAASHARGLKIILDFVPNHTSDQHPWFLDSRAGRGSARRDWYLWQDPAPDGGPPNNWLSNFGGVGWTLDAASGQYYYHSFLPTQPDLNWRNPAVVEAMHDVLRFWLRRGVDGFRVDVMWLMIKDSQFRNNPRAADGSLIPLYTGDQPEVHGVVAGLRTVLDECRDRVLIGELYLPIDRIVTYYGSDARPEAQLPFNFQLVTLARWDAPALADTIRRYEAALPPGAWPNWVLGNHDRPRVASRVGPAQARVAALLLLTLRGTPTLYMGDELGMLDTPIPPDAIRDPAELRQPGRGEGRDPERTPFPWQNGPGAGFTTGTPWLPIGNDTPLSVQTADPASMLNWHRALTTLRRTEPALTGGSVADVTTHGTVLSFRRVIDGTALTVIANTAGQAATAMAPAGIVLLGTNPARINTATGGTMTLEPDEALVLREAAPR